MKNVVLCADSECLMRPWLMGLDGVDLDSLDWLHCFSDAKPARNYMKTAIDDIESIWVISTDDVVNMNMAAALRKDAPTASISLIVPQKSGSAMSKAKAAGIESVLSPDEFSKTFAVEATRRKRMDEARTLNMNRVTPSEIPEISPGEICDKGRSHADKNTSYPTSVKESASEQDARSSSAFIVPVFSGSGGAGKSSISAIAAHYVASLGVKTVVIDCDFQFGDIAMLCGRKKFITVEEAIADKDLIAQLADDESLQDRPYLIGACSYPERMEAISACVGSLILECAKEFEAVIVNTGNGWSESHAQLLEVGTCPIFVSDQRASSIIGCQGAVELCTRMGIATGSFVYALNRCSRNALFSTIDASSAMHGAHIYELREGGSDVEELLGAGLADELLFSRNEYASSIQKMLDDVLPITGKRKRKKRRSCADDDISIASFNFFGKKDQSPTSKRKTKSRRRGFDFDAGTFNISQKDLISDFAGERK